MDDISGLASHAYGSGQDPLTFAEDLVSSLIEVHILVVAERVTNPGTLLGYSCPDISDGAGIEELSRCILGKLLDAGWTMPDAPAIAGRPA